MPGAQQAGRPAGAGGYRIVAFPREFERNIWEALDRRFYIILLSSLAFVYGMIILLANLGYSVQDIDDQIRQKYLKNLYTAEFVAETPETAAMEEGGSLGEEPEQKEEPKDDRAERSKGKRTEARGQSAAERRAAAKAAAAARGRQRDAIESRVSGMGVLGVLSAGDGGGVGEAVDDLVGSDGGGFGDLDQVLSQSGGLQTGTASSRRSRLGARKMGDGTGGTTGIDDLIEGGTGASSSKSIARRGKFAIKMEEGSVAGKGSKSTARSADAIGRVVTQHQDAIINCYRKEARLNPNLKGSITVVFTIRANGRVTRINISNSTLRNRSVESCVKSRIRSWRFQPIGAKEGDVTFRQKFVFTS